MTVAPLLLAVFESDVALVELSGMLVLVSLELLLFEIVLFWDESYSTFSASSFFQRSSLSFSNFNSL